MFRPRAACPTFPPCNFDILGMYFFKFFLFSYWLLGKKEKENKNRSWKPRKEPGTTISSQRARSHSFMGTDLEPRSCDWERSPKFWSGVANSRLPTLAFTAFC